MAPAEERARLYKLLQTKGLDAVAPDTMRAPYTPPLRASKAGTVIKEEPKEGSAIAEPETAKNDAFAFNDEAASSRSATKAVIRVPCKSSSADGEVILRT